MNKKSLMSAEEEMTIRSNLERDKIITDLRSKFNLDEFFDINQTEYGTEEIEF